MIVKDNIMMVKTSEQELYHVLKAIRNNCRQVSECCEKCNFYNKEKEECLVSFNAFAPEDWEFVLVEVLK